MLECERIHQTWSNRIDAGSTTFAVASPVSGGLPSPRCDALQEIDSVVAAGGRISSRSTDLTVIPSQRVQVDVVTPGFPRTMWPELALTGDLSLVAGSDVSRRLSLESGNYIDTSKPETTYQVSTVAKHAARISRFNNSLVVTSPTDQLVQECYVEAFPGSVDDVERLLGEWFEPHLAVSVTKVLPPRGTDPDPEVDYQSRVGRFLPILCGLMVSMLSLSMLWARRQEFALYRLLGASHAEAFGIFLVEFLAIYLVPVTIGVTAMALTNLDRLNSLVMLTAAMDYATLVSAVGVGVGSAYWFLGSLRPVASLKGG